VCAGAATGTVLLTTWRAETERSARRTPAENGARERDQVGIACADNGFGLFELGDQANRGVG